MRSMSPNEEYFHSAPLYRCDRIAAETNFLVSRDAEQGAWRHLRMNSRVTPSAPLSVAANQFEGCARIEKLGNTSIDHPLLRPQHAPDLA